MRLIDADQLVEILDDEYRETDNIVKKLIIICNKQILSDAPTVDAEPIRHGRWEEIKSGDWANATEYRCSECGKYRLAVNPVNYNWNYCPNCGAKMEGEIDE